MSDYIIDPVTRVATETEEFLKARVADYVKDLGARIPTLHSTDLTQLLALNRFGIFTYSGTPVALRAHIRTALIHNLRHLPPSGTFPTWRALSLNGLMDHIFGREDPDTEDLAQDILFIMSPEPHLSDKIQDVLVRYIAGRSVLCKPTILCTKDVLPWFAGKASSPQFHDQVVGAAEALEGYIAAEDVKRWNGCNPEELR